MSVNFLDISTGKDTVFSSAFHFAAIGMALVAPDGHWLMVNRALCQLTGYDEQELLSMTFQDITHPDDLEGDLSCIQQMLAGEIETYHKEKRYFHKNSSIIHILLSVSLVKDEGGSPIFFISQIQDISDRKKLEHELYKQATEDMLTGVNNRRQFFELAAREINRGTRYNEPMVLLMIDIDHFKSINDTHGHDHGDKVLQEMASTCKNILRSSDIFGRIGGEEFGTLLVNTEAIDGELIAERLRKSIKALTITQGDTPIQFTVSIGAVAFISDSLSLEERLKQSDNALYEAKRAGRNRVKMVNDCKPHESFFNKSQASFLRFSWQESYISGHKLIDTQHRRLFELSNNLLDRIMHDGDCRHCQDMLNELVQHVRFHLKLEEKVLKEIPYPEFTTHVSLHDILRQKMEVLQQRQKQGLLNIEEVFTTLAKDIIARHLLEEDIKFFPYLQLIEA